MSGMKPRAAPAEIFDGALDIAESMVYNTNVAVFRRCFL